MVQHKWQAAKSSLSHRAQVSRPISAPSGRQRTVTVAPPERHFSRIGFFRSSIRFLHPDRFALVRRFAPPSSPISHSLSVHLTPLATIARRAFDPGLSFRCICHLFVHCVACRPIIKCGKSGCTGSCPLSVVENGYSAGKKPATCRTCGKTFPRPNFTLSDFVHAKNQIPLPPCLGNQALSLGVIHHASNWK